MIINTYPIPQHESIYLVITSSGFMIPGIYAFVSEKYFLFTTSVITTAFSINFWRHATIGWRRDADLIVSKISFSIYFGNGLLLINNSDVSFIATIICLSMIGSFLLSNHLWKKNSKYWLRAHILFHMCIIAEQMIILTHLKNSNELPVTDLHGAPHMGEDSNL